MKAICAQIYYFKAMQFLVLFIAMGIGADDIFVIVNAWEQSETVLSPRVEVGLLGPKLKLRFHSQSTSG